MDAARPSGGSVPMGAARSRRRQSAPPRSSLRTSASRWAPARCNASATRRAITAPSTTASQAFRGPGRASWERRRGRIDTNGGARVAGAVPLHARPSDHTGARSTRCRLAAGCHDCSGAVRRSDRRPRQRLDTARRCNSWSWSGHVRSSGSGRHARCDEVDFRMVVACPSQCLFGCEQGEGVAITVVDHRRAAPTP